tara:strand:+ start:3565 stop:4740 length:1176 start_codon:yes stop_codon:yes gene_type:complete
MKRLISTQGISRLLCIAAIFSLFLVALVACGNTAGESGDAREKALANSPVIQTLEAQGLDPLNPNSGTVGNDVTSKTNVGLSMQDAQKQLWVFLSKCITIDTRDIEAVELEGNWYVRGSLQSSHETGLWKVPPQGESVEPYDQRAKEWLATIESDCSQEKMSVMTTPIPPTPKVGNGQSAAAAIWAYIVGCVSELSEDDVQAQDNPLNSEWVVTTDSVFVDALGRQADFGVWSVPYSGLPVSGLPDAKDDLAQAWNAYIFPTTRGEACAVEFIENIKIALPTEPTPAAAATPTMTPTTAPTATMRPVPTATPAIRNSTDAVNSVWAHLVPCFPTIKTTEFSATFDASKSNWVVIQDSGSASSTWSVSQSGYIAPTNSSAETDNVTVLAGSC